MPDFERDLNPEQLAVVRSGDGPCLVLAGAGSGKTRTVTYRVAYLLERGVAPENILLVTFTNKAAEEMVNRVKNLTGLTDKLPWAGTFHAIGHKILRAHAAELGYGRNFTILDSDDSEALVKLAAKDYSPSGGAGKKQKFPSAGVLQGVISFARNTDTTVEDILEARYPQFLPFGGAVREIAAEYEKKKKEANAMDFDDLLINTLRLLNKPAILSKYAEQFHYVLVDEYQDTNKIQSAIVKKLASKHKNILVVGDDAQSIYSFRGANIENILQFEKDFPGANIFRLLTNYRSSQEILSLANAVIANNPKQYKKDLRATLHTGVLPGVHPHEDANAEAVFIAGKIASLIRGGVDAHEIAVLFRAAHHSHELELELMRAGIDYDYRGGLRFFERSHVKDVLAYLRLMHNLADAAAWMRVLLHEDGIGPAAAGKIVEGVKRIKNLDEVGGLGDALGDRARGGWQGFLQIWEGMLDIGKGSPAKLVAHIVESPYLAYLQSEYLDYEERVNDIKQLGRFAGKYDNLEQFLAEAALQEAFILERQKDRAKKMNEGRVVLSTIHQAKGLEWSGVFVINLADGSFPHERALREDGGVEEERRLFYVAVTRAKKYLYLTYPMTRGAAGNNWGEPMAAAPSMFLGEIHPTLVDDRSFLGTSSTVFRDGDITYEEDEHSQVPPLKIRPGNMLRSVEDL